MSFQRAAAIGLLGAAALACRERAPAASSSVPAASSAPTVAAAASPEAGAADPQRLVGRWLRGDSDYVIEIRAVAPDGTLDASYSNPRPIHVSRAVAGRSAGALTVLLELQDRNYPGNFYTLTYDPGSDALAGVYHHLGLRQDFDVAFTRISAPAGSPAPTP